MAKFNPPVNPTGDPNYLSYSRPIDVPDSLKPTGQAANSILPKGAQYEGPQYSGNRHADETGLYKGRAEGLAYSGAGDLVRDSVLTADIALKGADATYKENIHQGVYEGATKIREDYIDNLTRTAQAVQGGGTTPGAGGGKQDPAAASQALDIVAKDPETTPPDELDQVGHLATGLKGARANGKLSSTDYAARLDTLARDFRSRYPGYKPFIDEEIRKVTGQDPANARIKSLIQDINAAANSGSNADNKNRAFVQQFVKENPNAADSFQRAMAGKESWAKAAFDVAGYAKTQAQWNYNKEALANNQGETDRIAADATSIMVNRSQAISDESIGNIKIKAEPIMKVLSDAAANPDAKTAVDWVQADPLVRQSQLEARARARKEFYEPFKDGPHKGQSPATLVKNQKAVEDMIEATGKQHDGILAAIALKDPGLANYSMNLPTAKVSDSIKQIVGSKEGAPLAIGMAIYKMGGNDMTAAMSPYLLTSKMNAEQKQEAMTQMYQFFTQPGINEKVTDPLALGKVKPGEVLPIKTLVEDAAKNGRDADYQKMILSFPQQILKPGGDSYNKYLAARGAFDPKNTGLIGLFDKEKVRPDGTIADGQFKAYGDLFSPAMTTTIKELSDKHSPDGTLWKQYTDRATGEFGSTLYKGALMDMKNVALPPGVTLGFNSKTSNFEVNNARGENLLLNNSPELNPANRRTFNFLNGGLSTLSNVFRAGGADDKATTVYLLQTMRSYGYDMRSGPALNIPGDILTSLLKSEREAQEKKK